ncbi:MAG TPA: uracil phosphoribosyltransferase [Pirellulaceae bacterium]|nr:uracil phosphoribosyltransferase [Pirellulaceae bacterium]HMO91775.1 uracil phosphoribosyltransferase [Pirellulaceae bacterium]HMP69574.1 uracil phosphoribosyltransferase [Pirellulaceae bacterium]
MSQIHVVDHPLVKHHLTVLRNEASDCFQFRYALHQLTRFVAVEASKDLQVKEVLVKTPIQMTSGHEVNGRIGLVPILRAGVAMVEPVLELIPNSEVWHLGMYRDEKTAKPVWYYSKLIPGRPVDFAFILDPMLATGGSAVSACKCLLDWGVSQIRMLSIISAPEGISRLTEEIPHLSIYTCAVDEGLNENNFIVPGLGDAGDRVFNTL